MSSFNCIHDFLKLEVCDGVADLDLPLSLSACADGNVSAPSESPSFPQLGVPSPACILQWWTSVVTPYQGSNRVSTATFIGASFPSCPSCQPLSSGFHRPSMATSSSGTEYKHELPRYGTHWFLPSRAQTVAWLPPPSACQTGVQCNTSSHRKWHYSDM